MKKSISLAIIFCLFVLISNAQHEHHMLKEDSNLKMQMGKATMMPHFQSMMNHYMDMEMGNQMFILHGNLFLHYTNQEFPIFFLTINNINHDRLSHLQNLH